ncbi:MAG: MBL fold metallo-hydrolase [Candidatus Hodarchaeota archaeon]
MESKSIIQASGNITKEVCLIDINQYNFPRISSIFILKTPKSVLIMDTGTSKDVKTLLKFLYDQSIPLRKIMYLVPSHYHFDHFGGGWKLWQEIKKYNPEVKVLTTENTKKKLQDPSLHMFRVKRTFGDSVGVMNPLPEEAYEIIDLNETIQIPGLQRQKKFKLLSTPGHTPDHVSPTLYENGNVKFSFNAESAGTLAHSSKLVTLPTSMPPEFNFHKYIESLKEIIELKPFNVGYGHFGAVVGQKSVLKVLNEHYEFSYWFKEFVRKKFNEGGSKTQYIVEQFLADEFKKRTEIEHQYNKLFIKTIVALIYGQLVDLGLKQPK